jgi:hypothetical protein
VVEQIGLGFKPFYRCNEKPGHFALLGIHTTALGFVLELPSIHAGKPMRRDKVIDAVAKEVLFESLSDETIDYMIDGDTYKKDGPLLVKTGPRLRFVRLTGDATSEAPLPDAGAA